MNLDSTEIRHDGDARPDGIDRSGFEVDDSGFDLDESLYAFETEPVPVE